MSRPDTLRPARRRVLPSHVSRRAWATGLLALLLAFVTGVPAASAQTTAVCSNTPATGERIECTEAAASTTDIDVDAEGVDIDTTTASEPGIKASHEGNAGIDVYVTYKANEQGQVTESAIDTAGDGAHGIQATHAGTGDVRISTITGAITTMGAGAHGISAQHTGATGNVFIATEPTTIHTEGEGSHGIFGETNAAGRLFLRADGRSITTTSTEAHGLYGFHEGVGALDMMLSNIDISTRNDGAHGVYGLHAGTGNIHIRFQSLGSNEISTMGPTDVNEPRAIGIFGEHRGFGNITIEASNSTITTTGANGSAIRGFVEHFTRDDPTQESVHNILIKTRSMDLRTSGRSAYGIAALYRLEWNTSGQVGSQGEIRIDARGGTIETDGINAGGVTALNSSNGDVVIDARDLTIRSRSHGIYGQKEKGASIDAQARFGDVTIYTEDLALETADPNSKGIVGWVKTDGDVKIEVVDTTIDTKSAEFVSGQNYTDSHGIWGVHQGIGDIDIDARGGSLTTAGTESWGIYGLHTGSGNIDIDLQGGSSVTTKGIQSHGVYGRVSNTANGDDIIIKTRDHDVLTESTALRDGFTFAVGVRGRHDGVGNIDINLQGGSVETRGVFSYGVYGQLSKSEHGGNLKIETGGGNAITTSGANGYGIVAYNYGTMATGRTSINVGGNVTTTGTDAQGVRVGTVSSGNAARVAPIGADGFRQQTVTVNGSITSAAEGVYMAGGGRVVIGPRGSITSGNGIAILATGDTPGADPVNDPAIKPTLRVDMNLGGRRVAQAIGDDWIINDGGETTIAMNGTVLHDGATGVTNGTASNGAWNVRMRAEGVTVTDRTTDPWTVSEPAANVIADRDFSAQDFNERRKPSPPPPPSCPDGQVGTPPNCEPPPPMCPVGQVGTPPNCEPPPPSCPDVQAGTPPNCEPPPPSCPDGQVGTPPNCTASEPERPMFMEEYAPRAAVYEALPDFLLRLTGPGPNRKCRTAPDEPAWVRFAGGQGSYQADRSTTGATYDLDRFETEGGLSKAFNEKVRGWVSVRHVWGGAGVGSPTGGGRIEVRGLGSSVGGAWQSPTGAYALGCFSYMNYNVDFASDQRGPLKVGTNGRAYTLDFEAGRRFPLTDQVQVTPRLWVVGSRVAVDSFTDAVDARVSFADADRITGGLGVLADTTRAWGKGNVTLRGSVDYERMFSGAETRVQVSGEPLSAAATENSLLVGLQGVYRYGRFSIGAELAARQELGSADSEYASFINLGVQF